MNLNEYQWSRNPRGMHSTLNYLDTNLLANHRMGWAKIVALGDGEISLATDALNKGMTPIVRIYRERPGNAPVDPTAMTQFQAYRSAGVHWFEYYNEPNLNEEWPRGNSSDPNNPQVINPLMDHWLIWAETIINLGGYPGFPALADNNNGLAENTTTWVERMLTYLFDTHFERFRAVLNNGCYIATHPYVLNHFYQEAPGSGPRSARPAEQQNVAEGGWHFEYPYDPICQYDDPGRTVWGGTPLAPYGDTVSLLGSAWAIMERLQTMFGVGAIPVVGTEGGIYAPTGRAAYVQQDRRYPGYTWDSHAQATIAMFEWIALQAPPWLFGVTLWKFDDYYQQPDGPLPVGELCQQRPVIYKDVPSLPAIAQEVAPELLTVPTVLPPGPGPIHGAADFHFVFLTPGIDYLWFFETAETYWDQFKPTLMNDLEFIDFLPNDKSLVVTAITPPNMIDWLNLRIVQRWPNVWVDFIVVQHPDDLAQYLDERVATGRRFG